MTPEQLNGYVLVFGVFVRMGIDAVAAIKAVLRSDKERTDDELNAIVAEIQADSRVKRAESAAIAFGV